MANTDVIVGTWFPTGYHGHFRSKSRLDFLNEYRHISKPTPPKTFVNRSKLKPTFNVFSKHDNRHSFVDNAIYFEGGLGRRRFKSANRPQPDMLAWMPEKKEWEKRAPQHSVYRLNFQESPAKPIKEQIIRRPKTSFDEQSPVTTSYRYSHGNTNPNRDLLSAMSNTGLSTMPNRRVTTQGSGRESVAHCLNWYTPPTRSAPTAPSRPNRPLVPASTQPVLIEPHPPAGPPPSQSAPLAVPAPMKVTPVPVRATPTVVCQPAPAPPMPAAPQQPAKVQIALTE